MGTKLRELRGDRSQAEIASDLMISESAVSAYETGERVPRDDLKRRIAAYFGKTVGEIFFDE